MDSFVRNADRNRTGKHCELLVITAFSAEGAPISLPFGNQSGWDMLVKEGTRWMEVQVKTATAGKCSGFSCGLTRCSGSKAARYGTTRVYQVGDCDYIVAVMPETGTIWKIPIACAAGKRSLSLKDAWLWQRGTAMTWPPKTTARRSKMRRNVLAMKPAHKPDRISGDTWNIVEQFAAGATKQQIAAQYGLAVKTISGRIGKAIKRFTPSSTGDLMREING